jgi:hypothetical protein
MPEENSTRPAPDKGEGGWLSRCIDVLAVINPKILGYAFVAWMVILALPTIGNVFRGSERVWVLLVLFVILVAALVAALLEVAKINAPGFGTGIRGSESKPPELSHEDTVNLPPVETTDKAASARR